MCTVKEKKLKFYILKPQYSFAVVECPFRMRNSRAGKLWHCSIIFK